MVLFYVLCCADQQQHAMRCSHAMPLGLMHCVSCTRLTQDRVAAQAAHSNKGHVRGVDIFKPVEHEALSPPLLAHAPQSVQTSITVCQVDTACLFVHRMVEDMTARTLDLTPPLIPNGSHWHLPHPDWVQQQQVVAKERLNTPSWWRELFRGPARLLGVVDDSLQGFDTPNSGQQRLQHYKLAALCCSTPFHGLWNINRACGMHGAAAAILTSCCCYHHWHIRKKPTEKTVLSLVMEEKLWVSQASLLLQSVCKEKGTTKDVFSKWLGLPPFQLSLRHMQMYLVQTLSTSCWQHNIRCMLH